MKTHKYRYLILVYATYVVTSFISMAGDMPSKTTPYTVWDTILASISVIVMMVIAYCAGIEHQKDVQNRKHKEDQERKEHMIGHLVHSMLEDIKNTPRPGTSFADEIKKKDEDVRDVGPGAAFDHSAERRYIPHSLRKKKKIAQKKG